MKTTCSQHQKKLQLQAAVDVDVSNMTPPPASSQDQQTTISCMNGEFEVFHLQISSHLQAQSFVKKVGRDRFQMGDRLSVKENEFVKSYLSVFI